MGMYNTYSLKNSRDFKIVYDNGIHKTENYFVMYVLDNNSSYNRIGISVSKKVGNSVVRHRIKRLVKECYRIRERDFRTGIDIVIIARHSASNITYDKVSRSLEYLGKKLGIHCD